MTGNHSLPGSTTWNALIADFPASHLLQTSQWAELKSRYGWTPYYLIWDTNQSKPKMRVSQDSAIAGENPSAAGLLLERQALAGLRVHYLPKGPLLRDKSDLAVSEKVLEDLAGFARMRGALQIKIDPDILLGRGVPGKEGYREIEDGLAFQELLERKGWRFSQEQIQFRNTVLIDLQEDEDSILARMKSKTRYNIRLSGRKGITIRRGTVQDLPALYRMYADTSQRAGFTIRGEPYYLTLWHSFMEGEARDPQAQSILAEFEGQLVAGAVIFKFGQRAWYLHGMSSPDHREKMAPHLIQWEAIRWAKEQGCKVYDMWGAPDQFDESDSLWGVYRFKRGYGGEVTLSIGAWDYPARPGLYAAYNRWLPKILNIARWFGDRRTNRAIKPED